MFKKLLTHTLILFFTLSSISCDQSISTTQAGKDTSILEVLSKMSLEEKVGQMTQITLGVVMSSENPEEIDMDKLRYALEEKKVGSILNTNGVAFSVAQWHKLLTTIQDVALQTSSKIPVIYGIDAIHGTNYTVGSTLFPHNIGMAAARNPALAKQAAKITALETRASGIRWNFDPTIGIGRQPLWSRFEETYGEDVHLLQTMTQAVIEGYEEDGLRNTSAVASCMKHFLGYSFPHSGKDRTPAYIPENMLREYFLPSFETAVKAGTATVMINSGEINGTPIHGSSYYLKTILRDEMGFEGVAVSDWEDVIRLYTRHRIASSPREAVKIGVNAGIDMSMVPDNYSFFDHLVDLVKTGEVSMERIDEAVYRILKLKFDVGLFDNAYPEKDALEGFGNPDYQKVAKQAALESITLLKNENEILPISKSSKVLLVGPAANDVASLHSSWSYTWQGTDDKSYPTSTKTIKQAIEQKIGAKNVISNAVRGFDDKINFDVNFIKSNARKVDCILLALGEGAYSESPGVIDDLTLDQNQLVLANAAISSGKPVILLLAEGRPRIISSIEPGIDGVLLLYRPGSEGAQATADILFGDYNPSGKLPFTYHRFSGDIVMYDHKPAEKIREATGDKFNGQGYHPQWPFGHGLSYTDFAYDQLAINKDNLTANDSIEISIQVKNVGQLEGQETIELYVSDLYASITPHTKRLKKYKKINLQPGESKLVAFSITGNDLSFINAQSQRVVEPGEFTLSIDDLTLNFNYH